MELLSDPVRDRVVTSLPPPPHRPLSKELMFPAKLKEKPDWKVIKEHLTKEGVIAKEELVKLVTETNKIFKAEGNLLYMEDPINVIGDIHGQFYDLIKILEIGGDPSEAKYLFLGDFVDRGSFSIEVLVLLYAIKLSYPKTFTLLRGNHECRQMTTFFNFRAECLYKYDQEVFDIIMDSFDMMPLACIVNGKFLAIHGGISPELKTIEDIKRIDRFKEPPKQGIICDLLWADPVDNRDGSSDTLYKVNDTRGCSFFYGREAVSKFLHQNNLLSIIRAHEAQLEGFKMHTWTRKSDFPMVITIFSAPNYCDVYQNKGALIQFNNNTLNIRQFNCAPHPYVLPNYMDIFTWSLPFVSEKVTEMLFNLIKPENEGEESDDEDDADLVSLAAMASISSKGKEAGLHKRGDILRSKVKFMSKMVKMNKSMREQNEMIVKYREGLSSDNKIKIDLVSKNKETKDTSGVFTQVRQADMLNEKRPTLQ